MPRLGRGRPVEPLIITPRPTASLARFGSVSLGGGGSLSVTARKGSSAGVSSTGGGIITIAFRKSGQTSLSSTGGGSLVLQGRKASSQTLALSGGGSLSTTGKKIGAGGLAMSGGGQPSVQVLRPGAVVFTTFVAGGGGRLGRSHPVMAALPRAAPVLPYVPNSGASVSGGGTIATSGSTSRFGTVKVSGGGDLGVSGAGAQAPMVVTVVIGGGGRLGRSHPVTAVAPTGRARVFAPNLNTRSGAVAMSGGGSVTANGVKTGRSEYLGDTVAPPMFLTFVQGFSLRGGGTLAATGTAAIRTAAVRLSGGGSLSVSGHKVGRGTVATTGGGQLVVQESKAAFRVSSISGGGTITAAGRKTAKGVVSATGGGTIAIAYVLRVARSLDQPFVVRAVVGSSLEQRYNTATSGTAGASLAMPYNANVSVGASLGMPYVVAQTAGGSLIESYVVRSAVGKSLATPYSVGLLTPVGASLDTGYTVRVPVGHSLAAPYSVGGTVGSSLVERYSVAALQVIVTESLFTHTGQTALLSNNHLVVVQEDTLEVVPV